MAEAKHIRVRKNRVSFEVEAEIDLDEVLEDVTDDDLRKTCIKRGVVLDLPKAVLDKRESFFDLADDMRRCMRGADALHFEVLLIRMQVLAGVPALSVPRKVVA